MRAEIVAVGSELLRLGRHDTNGDWMQARLEALGIEVVARAWVDDDVSRIASLVRAALDRSELIAVSGGLGPTADDVTREALAVALGVALVRDPAQLEQLERAAASRGVALTPGQARQAERPRGAEWIDNPVGTAPGLVLEGARATLYALPGVPAELQAMFLASVAPRLAGIGTGRARRSLRVFGPTESVVDERLGGLAALAGVERTLLAAPEGIELHLTAIGPSEADAERCVARAEQLVRAELGADVVGPSEETVATAVGRALAARGLRLASAESCTAGLLGAVLTAAPGASAWYRGGWIVYADDLKLTLCGIDPRLLEEHGAVSAEVALALAQAARERLGADVAVAITGIAGPGGGSAEKPVGTVHIAVCDSTGQLASRHHFGGDRESVRRRAVHTALDRLRRRLLERS